MAHAELWAEKILGAMEHTHSVFAAKVPPPTKVPFGDGFAYRYVERTLEQVVIQKLARIITGLRSAHLLLTVGFLQEAAILQRGVDEAQEDTVFVVYGKICGPWTPTHDRFLENFWAETPSQKGNLRRHEIRDYIATVESNLTGASHDEIVKPAIHIYSMYSKYTHAASAHVMELFDGSPPQWQLRGNANSQLQRDHLYDIRNQYFRGATAYAFAALLFNDPFTFRQFMSLADSFMKATGSQS